MIAYRYRSYPDWSTCIEQVAYFQRTEPAHISNNPVDVKIISHVFPVAPSVRQYQGENGYSELWGIAPPEPNRR